MANRICIGNHPNHGYGIYVSRPGVDVLSNIKKEDLVFDSRSPESSLISEVINASIPANSTTGSAVSFATNQGFIPHVDLIRTNGSGGSSIPIRFLYEVGFSGGLYTNRWLQEKALVSQTQVTVSMTYSPNVIPNFTRYFKVIVYKIPSAV